MNRNTLIAIVVGIGLLLAAAYFLFVRTPSNAVVTSSEPSSPAELTFVNLASQLEPLGFDTAILSDPRFTALVDIHTAIIPEQAGRRDPFAPF
jgi:hypothetical protein